MTRRIAMGLEYDGTRYHGWQAQTGVATVQTTFESAISRVAAHPIRVHCAGRTDTGVHALAQVVHFETTAERPERAWVLGTNVNLPPDCSVIWARSVADDFHARFAATARHYRYRILPRATRSAIERDRALWVHRPLDVDRMREAATVLVGEHDFTSFRALACQAKSPVRWVHYLDLLRAGEIIELRIGANGFLHHMVRNIVGVLLAIGRGEASVDWTSELLGLRDRTLGGVTAPPQGLFLSQVDYPGRFALPIGPAGSIAPEPQRQPPEASGDFTNDENPG